MQPEVSVYLRDQWGNWNCTSETFPTCPRFGALVPVSEYWCHGQRWCFFWKVCLRVLLSARKLYFSHGLQCLVAWNLLQKILVLLGIARNWKLEVKNATNQTHTEKPHKQTNQLQTNQAIKTENNKKLNQTKKPQTPKKRLTSLAWAYNFES